MKDKIYFAKGDSPQMIEAYQKAQDTFKYFWREMSWEYRRIVPALNLACVKVAFNQQIDGEEAVEHMWVNDISFDGENIKGTLINDPHTLTNVKNGDSVAFPLGHISDWLFAIDGKTFGGFTIQVMRSEMSEDDRQDHDKAWGLDFGDFNDVLIVHQQKERPENLTEHPMCVNMGGTLEEFLKGTPSVITDKDDDGYTMLHRETIAGNKLVVEQLLRHGASPTEKTHQGKTALDFARQLNWERIVPLLEN